MSVFEVDLPPAVEARRQELMEELFFLMGKNKVTDSHMTMENKAKGITLHLNVILSDKRIGLNGHGE